MKSIKACILIDILKDDKRTKINVTETGYCSFESFQYPFDYHRGHVLTCEQFYINDLNPWDLHYSFDADTEVLSNKDRIHIEKWLYNYVISELENKQVKL